MRKIRKFPSKLSGGNLTAEKYLFNGKSSGMFQSMAKILDELRTAIEASGKSRYRLAQESGVAESGLSRLMSGERGLGVESAERLADVLGYELRLVKRRGTQKER